MANIIHSESLSLKLTGVDEAKLLLKGIEPVKVLVRAINKTITGAKTEVKNAIADKVNLTKTFIEEGTSKKGTKTFSTQNATWGNPVGHLKVCSANVPLIQYSNQRGAGKVAKKITVQVLKSKPKWTASRHIFKATMRSGHIGLFHLIYPPERSSRTGNLRFKEMFGPRISGHLLREVVWQDVSDKIKIRADYNLAHETDVAIKRIA
jgi:hypothetical protein